MADLSPNYPRYIFPDVIVMRTAQWQKFKDDIGFLYRADLTDGHHNVLLSGPLKPTEQEAVKALGEALRQKADLLQLRAIELSEYA